MDARSEHPQRLSHARTAAGLALGALLWAALPAASAPSDPSTGLPAGSELDDDAAVNPREVFHSEVTGGRRSYLSSLGNLAFNSPSILGAAARKAHISCGSCHVNGATNTRLFIPGLSSRPGTFDTTNALFDPTLDNHRLDALRIPSLRGARLTAPYAHDGRFATLRDFVQHAIVSEFSGAAPSAQLLDAIAAYIEDIDFLANPALTAAGQLSEAADDAARRGEQLFRRPFPADPDLSCASCHVPEGAFVDHQLHEVGSGGLYKTPTLLNANFAAGYFHDARYSRYSEVIEHFDQRYGLKLSAQDKSDLAAYLTAVGGGAHPEYRVTGNNVLEDCDQFASVLNVAIPRQDLEVITLAVTTVSEQLQSLADHYQNGPSRPDGRAQEHPEDPNSPGEHARALARTALKTLSDALQQIGRDAQAGRFEAAAADYVQYRKIAAGLAPVALAGAERWSTFAAPLPTP